MSKSEQERLLETFKIHPIINVVFPKRGDELSDTRIIDGNGNSTFSPITTKVLKTIKDSKEFCKRLNASSVTISKPRLKVEGNGNQMDCEQGFEKFNAQKIRNCYSERGAYMDM